MALFEARDVTVTYQRDGRSYEPFHDIGFSLEGGEVVDLVGPSGSGKSTLLTACARLITGVRGTFLLEGEDSSTMDPAQWRRRVCYVPQRPCTVAGTVRDNLLLPWTLRIRRGETPPTDGRLRELIEATSLSGVDLDRDASQLSGGELARVALLRIFATDPVVLLLDEVDAALDKESALAVSALTRDLVHEDMACVRIRHRPPDGYADRALRLADGSIGETDPSKDGE